jgi:hypothetical protein
MEEEIKMKELKMKSKIFYIGLLISFLVCNITKAQPYIYFSKSNEFTEKILRYNLASNLVEDFFPNQDLGKYASAVWDPSQSYILIDVEKQSYKLYKTINPSVNFDLNEIINDRIVEMLFLPQTNRVYAFSVDYEKLFVIDIINGDVIFTTGLGQYTGWNSLMVPTRSTFFSSDKNKIYLFHVDSMSTDQVWIYSLQTNEIIEKRNLSELSGHNGSDCYNLMFGKNGKGIIDSAPLYSNPVKEFYYRLYNFDSNVPGALIYHSGLSEAYFNCNGEFILIMDTHLDDSLRYYHTGIGKIYNSQTGQLVKTISVPAGGIIYTFDNYPNDIYYVKNIETQPEIYNLTKLKINSITPGLSLPYTSSLVITVNGGLFTSSSQAYFNNQPRTTTYLTDTTLSVQLNAGDLSTMGNYPLWVSNYGSNSDTLTYSVVSALPQPITPLVECVKNNGGGSYTAKFGYRNDNTKSVFVPVGTNNKFSPTPENRGQPTIFLTGRNYEVFSVNFDGRNLVWNIFSKKATASKNSTPCP